jgi:hypothetical protein
MFHPCLISLTRIFSIDWFELVFPSEGFLALLQIVAPEVVDESPSQERCSATLIYASRIPF